MDSTLTAILRRHTQEGAATRVPQVLGLVLLWSREEPQRVGEVALFAPSPDGRAHVLGRAGGRRDLVRAEWQRQRPDHSVPTGALTSPRISRDQVLIQPLLDGRLALTNVGRLELRLRGEPIAAGVARTGDLVELADEALMLVVRRPLVMPIGELPADNFPGFGEPDSDGLVGESPRMWALRDQLAFVGGRGAHVLIRGASGTGKELAAQAIHRRSPRRARPLVARNAATIPDSLLDAELFGTCKNFPQSGMPERPGLVGEADGSTLFLDEFAEMPAAMQAHLLRLMDHGEYQRLGDPRSRRADLRLVAATNRPESALKHDILARMQIRVELPGLDERREDIPLLARALLRRIAASDPAIARRWFPGGDPRGLPAIGPRLIAALVTHPYTTHVRELEALLWQSMARSRGSILDTWDGLPPRWQVAAPAPTPVPVPTATLTQDLATAEPPANTPHAAAPGVDPLSIPAAVVQACLDRHEGRQEPVWRELGLASRHVLTRLVRRHGLKVRGRQAS